MNDFDMKDWKLEILRAKDQRKNCGWDEQADIGWRIYNNDLPLNKKDFVEDAEKWKGLFIVHNWIYILLKYKISMLTGSEITIDAKTYDGSYATGQSIVEHEVNYGFDQFKFLDEAERALYSKYFTGMGWKRNTWNTRKRNPQYLTGIPEPEWIDSRCVWIDPKTKKPDKSDRDWVYYEQEITYRDVKKRYPSMYDQISATTSERRPDVYDVVKIGTLQYKEHNIIRKVFIEDTNSGLISTFTEQEVKKYIEDGNVFPESVEIVKTEVTPDGVYEIEEDSVYEVIIAPDHDLLLTSPRYVGTVDDFQCNPGRFNIDVPYSFGEAWYMKDMQEADIIVQTIHYIQIQKWFKVKEKVIKGSLENEAEYLRDGHKLGVNPVEKEGWQKNNPGSRSTEYLPLPPYPMENERFHQTVEKAQKDFAGTPDVAMGQVESISGLPGITVAQLTANAKTYHRDDVKAFRSMVQADCEWLVNRIVEHRNYAHTIKSIDMTTGDETPLEVATNAMNTLTQDNIYIDITIQENHEIARELERQYANELQARGFIAPLDYLDRTGDKNPEVTLKNATEYNQTMAMAQKFGQLPAEVQQQIDQFMTQAMSNTQTGNPAQPSVAM